MRFETYDRRSLFGRRYYWRLVASNNEVIAQGEAYNSPSARDHVIELMRSQMPTCAIAAK